ncbi:MAG TPA: GNAT family N-acetyltransferase, partial [Euzebyales bacterium]|nr:GNAT family N-acetyltransferase [Euzebyales bacterium]
MTTDHHEGAASADDVLELERIAALGWPGLETKVVDGWLLRAGGGWTGRANAALPLRDAGDDLDAVLRRVARWYRTRDLPPLVQVPLPACTSLRDRLVDRGWVDRWGAVVLTAAIDDVLERTQSRPDLPPVTFGDAPDLAWLDAYHYLGGSLPEVAVDVLRAGAPCFLSVAEGGETISICRIAVTDGWLGITAVEVAQAHRRRGLATNLLVAALGHARAGGATRVYVQTTDDNEATLTLYCRAGFTRHHHYRYHGPPPDVGGGRARSAAHEQAQHVPEQQRQAREQLHRRRDRAVRRVGVQHLAGVVEDGPTRVGDHRHAEPRAQLEPEQDRRHDRDERDDGAPLQEGAEDR